MLRCCLYLSACTAAGQCCEIAVRIGTMPIVCRRPCFLAMAKCATHSFKSRPGCASSLHRPSSSLDKGFNDGCGTPSVGVMGTQCACRQAARDQEIAGYHIRKDQWIGCAVYAMHRDPKFWQVASLLSLFTPLYPCIYAVPPLLPVTRSLTKRSTYSHALYSSPER